MPRWQKEEAPWIWAALALALALWLLVAYDVFYWHPGYARGDESDVVSFLQRVREGMPWRPGIGNGSWHKALVLGAMAAFPGRLWVTSLPGLLALFLEALLLFVLGRRLGGARAGFFAVFVGLCSAFTLIRARVGLSLSLFPAEWLALVWLRSRCRSPWAWCLWGACAALLVLDYEAWMPGLALLFLVPFLEPLSPRQRAWELGAAALCFACIVPPAQLIHALERRHASSFAAPVKATASAGWQGVLGLVRGGVAMPYLEPVGLGVVPWWSLVAGPVGLFAMGKRCWAPLLYLVAGAGIVVAGGAPYGLPAHRFVAAWPAFALVAGLGLAEIWRRLDGAWARRFFAVALTMVGAQQLWGWAANQDLSDDLMRGPVRNRQAAAVAAWDEAQRQHLPLVTELHPLKGSETRFLTGHAPALPAAGTGPVVAVVPWEYLPAIRGTRAAVATFQEEGGQAPGLAVVLQGASAVEAVGTERALRPLFNQSELFSLDSRAQVAAWLAQAPPAKAWARTEALDYLSYTDLHTGAYSSADIVALRGEKLVSARPLIIAASSTTESLPDFAVETFAWAHKVDPHNGAALSLMEPVLRSLGRDKEADQVAAEIKVGRSQGRLLWD